MLSAANCPLSEQQSAAIMAAVDAFKTARAISLTQAIVIEAVAGSGKTHTLKALIRVLKSLDPTITICYLVFNKKNQVSMSVDIPESLASVSTFHSKGFTAFSRALKGKRLQTDSNKLRTLMEETNVPFQIRSVVARLVSMVKARAITLPSRDQMLDIIEHYGLESDLLEAESDLSLDELIELAILHAVDLLKASKTAAYNGLIDFDDQLYMPVIDAACLSQQYQKFDVVLIDECQDTSTVRRELAAKLVKANGLIVAVGDRYQAIYGFTGADNDAVEQITRKFEAVVMPLSITYRCPKAVVSFAKQLLPDAAIEAHESAPDGQVIKTSLSKILADLDFRSDDYILCRYNKPLIEILFSLLAKGIACQILGKDVAAGLVKLTKKWSRVKTLSALADKLNEFLDKQVKRLLEKGKESAADALQDQINCLLFLIDEMPAGASLGDLQAKINSMFVDENGDLKPVLTLMSCHKSKGLESNRVFWIGRSKFQPSGLARKDWQIQQEYNLMYVSATRAKQTLFDVTYDK